MATEVNIKTEQPPAPTKVVTTKGVEDRVPWQRLALSLLGIAILAGMWRWATFHLYALPEHSISAYTSLTNNTIYAIASIVVFFISGKMLFDWKNQSTSTVVEQASHLFEHKDEHVDISQKIEHVIEEGAVGSPTTKPWSQNAEE